MKQHITHLSSFSVPSLLLVLNALSEVYFLSSCRFTRFFWIVQSAGVCHNVIEKTKSAERLRILKVLNSLSLGWVHEMNVGGAWFIHEYRESKDDGTLWKGKQLKARQHFMRYAIAQIKAEIKNREIDEELKTYVNQ